MSRLFWKTLGFVAVLIPLGALAQASTSLGPDDLAPSASQISAVTVYGHGAIVTRNVQLSANEGSFLVRDLPGNLDTQSLRVRAGGQPGRP